MENASKALLMAGSLLIGVLTIALVFNLFRQSGGLFQSFEERRANDEIQAYNAPFTSLVAISSESRDYVDEYGETKTYESKISIYDIISVVNYARDINDNLYYPDGVEHNHESNYNYIVVDIEGIDDASDLANSSRTQSFYHGLIKTCGDFSFKVKDDGIEYSPDGKVNHIIFEKRA